MALFGQNYFLSLPERTIRSAAALVGGASLLLTETLLPDVLRESVTYRVTIGDFQRFLITRLAQVQPAELAFQETMSDAYLSRKVAGITSTIWERGNFNVQNWLHPNLPSPLRKDNCD